MMDMMMQDGNAPLRNRLGNPSMASGGAYPNTFSRQSAPSLSPSRFGPPNRGMRPGVGFGNRMNQSRIIPGSTADWLQQHRRMNPGRFRLGNPGMGSGGPYGGGFGGIGMGGGGLDPRILSLLGNYGGMGSKFGGGFGQRPENWQEINRQNAERNNIGRWLPSGGYAS